MFVFTCFYLPSVRLVRTEAHLLGAGHIVLGEVFVSEHFLIDDGVLNEYDEKQSRVIVLGLGWMRFADRRPIFVFL